MNDVAIKEAALAAVREDRRDWATNALAEQALWRSVNIAVDAAVEEMARQTVTLDDTLWVLTYLTKPLIICLTRARARRQVKAALRISGLDRRDYTIHEVLVERNIA